MDSACQKLILSSYISRYSIEKYTEKHPTANPDTNEHIRHLFIQLVYKSLLLSCRCHFAVCCFRPPTFPILPFLFFLLLHPTPQKLQPSAREWISHGTLQSSIPVLCCVIVFLFSSLAVTILVGVWLFGAGIVGGVVLV